ncbi:histidinol-phosphatase [bacterium BMS3Abin09]|nr:histidinol-phosphatase [bacterium BMS3Abin09]GBE40545.1 histidinol-phosphatase [bacterium BMS3Bbin09]HDH34342.1 PHP domain-containing protein [Nitrospirota bacterium]HDO66849.1 PHP domain-containing protein [Nitrospirota bacterium]HEW81023.1 PHP domain-containing protein [Nitrospirota bacterium]
MKFKIDLHIHTKHSGDNNSEPEDVVIHAIDANLNGIAFTEHYSYEASEYVDELRGKYGKDILIFRGVEFSAADGHCLVFGVDTDRAGIRGATMKEVVRVVNEKGGVVIPTHPFRGGYSIGERARELKGICAIEGYNGYSHYSQNKKAIEMAEEMGLQYTGGSDSHSAHEVGVCYTDFNTEVTYENLIEILKTGDYKGVDTRKVSKIWPF